MGLGHVYADRISEKWVPGTKSLNDSDHAIYNTLQQIYERKQKGKDVSSQWWHGSVGGINLFLVSRISQQNV